MLQTGMGHIMDKFDWVLIKSLDLDLFLAIIIFEQFICLFQESIQSYLKNRGMFTIVIHNISFKLQEDTTRNK